MDSKFPKAITDELIIPASVSEVYAAWTTHEGIMTFFAPPEISADTS